MANYSMAHHRTYWMGIYIILLLIFLIVAGVFAIYFTFKQTTGII